MCHDVLRMIIDIKNIATLNIHGLDYRFVINKISKCEAINLLENACLREKVEHYKI